MPGVNEQGQQVVEMGGEGEMAETAAPHTRVGFIGLGAMGSRMAANVQRAEYPLVVYARKPEQARPLAEHGATVVASAREVAAKCDVLMLMLSDPDAVRSVLSSDDGVLAGARDGLVLIDSSTVGPADAMATVETAAAHGVSVLHASVLGSLKPAADGELIVLLGGAEVEAERQRPLLRTIGKEIHYLGPNERACAMKLAVNVLVLSELQVAGEAVAMATRWGVPRDQVLSIIGGAAAASQALKGRLGTMFDAGAPVSFPLGLGRKDLWLALSASYEKGASAPLIAAALETFSMAALMHGAEDVARVASFIDEMSS